MNLGMISCSVCGNDIADAADSDGLCDTNCCKFTCMKCLGESK